MRKISQNEIKKIQLDMLIDFADFCDRNGITYYLSSGTLLGAIRHKGFIPWDDDIDIMLPRPDYEKAMSLYHSERYFLDSISVDPDSICRCGRMNCSNTILKSNLKKKYQTQVFIDVFPIDGITSNKLLQKLKLSIIQIMINFHMSTITAYQSTKHYADKEAGLFNYKQHIRTLGKFILISTIGHSSPQFWIKCINNWLKKTNFETADVVGFFAGGYYGMREIMDRDIYSGKVRVEFEGHQFWAPAGYDRYLRNLYGNYMKLPPPEKRQSHHDFEAYWVK